MLKRLILRPVWLLLAVAVGVPVAAQQLSADQTGCLNRGSAFSLDVQIGSCTALLQSGSLTQANRAVAYYNRGQAYATKKDYDRAIADFSDAIRLDPKDAGFYSNRGTAYERKGDNDRAITDFRRALAIDPTLQSGREALKRLGASP